MRARHQDARERDDPDELDRIDCGRAGERRALDLHEVVDRNALGVRVERRERVQECDPVLCLLAHAEDPAAADVDARIADGRERVEAILVSACRDDLAVESFRGVEVVVVVVEARFPQALRLRRRQHAERRAGLEPERRDAGDHLDDLVEVAVLGTAPGRAHAEARRAGIARGARARDDGRGLHQRLALEARVVADALRAIGAVLGTGACLDRKQRRDLHLVRIEVAAMRGLRRVDQVGKGERMERSHFLESPVGPDIADRAAVAVHCIAPRSNRKTDACRAFGRRNVPPWRSIRTPSRTVNRTCFGRFTVRPSC